MLLSPETEPADQPQNLKLHIPQTVLNYRQHLAKK